MTSPWFGAVKSTSTSGLELILPVLGQKVKGISPSPLEVLIGSGEEKPARSTYRTVIATCFGHNLDTRQD